MKRFRLLRRIRRETKGAAAIEFAIIAPVFFMMLWAIFETGLVFFAKQTLTHGLQVTSRQIRTGQAQSAELTPSQFRAMVCAQVNYLLSCDADKLYIDIQSYASFPQDGLDAPRDDDGKFDTENASHFDIGESGNISGAPASCWCAPIMSGPSSLPTWASFTRTTKVATRYCFQRARRSKMNPSKIPLRQRLERLRGNAVHDFAAATSGMAAAEFAMISPILIAMFFGVTEFSNVYEANTKMTAVASTLADLLAQEKTVCNAERDAAFGAATTIMYPFPSSDIKLRVSSLIDNGNGTVKVAWSDVNGDDDDEDWRPLAVNDATPDPVPEGLVTTGGSVILAEVTYTYALPVHRFFAPSVTFRDKYYLHPRKVDQIGRQTACS